MFKFKLSKKGILFGFMFLSCFLLFLGSEQCLAQTNELGNYSSSEANTKFKNELTLKTETSSYQLSPAEISLWLKSQTDFRPNSTYFSEIENIDFCNLKKSPLCELSFSFLNRYHIQKYSRLSIDQGALRNFLADLARKINRDPVDAKLQFDGVRASIFAISEDGISLDIEKSLKIIEDYFRSNAIENELELPHKITKPNISTASIDNLGVTELIGEGHSDFSGSTRSRIFNINVAVKRFQGVLIKPGEEFSFVEILGEVDGEHGYLPELVIKKDKTEPEFGGGICQVSTTVFRAAIYSGLKITSRRNHAYPVHYYDPQGMDATVYIPRPDLRFVNNTPGHILIQSEISGTELTFLFYGTDDGREIKIDGPKIIEWNSDGSMKTTFSQIIKAKDGSIIIDDVFNSNYDSPAKYPTPGQEGEIFTEKPDGWSEKEWKKYKKDRNL